MKIPSTSLIDALSNEISREVVFKLLPLFKWVVGLCVRHGSRLKPAVEHFTNSLQRRLARAL